MHQVLCGVHDSRTATCKMQAKQGHRGRGRVQGMGSWHGDPLRCRGAQMPTRSGETRDPCAAGTSLQITLLEPDRRRIMCVRCIQVGVKSSAQFSATLCISALPPL